MNWCLKWLRKLIKFGMWMLILAIIAGAAAIAATYYYLVPELPSTENLKNVQFQVPLRVYSRDLRLIAEYGEKRRIPLDYKNIPKSMINAILAAEDNRFFQHPGVDYKGLIRAAVQLALTGEKRQGGSTITMQVARNFYLSRKKTYLRKLNEILLALRIDKELSKPEILELYLNKIYLGHRAYGVGAAAQIYYGKSLDQLDLAQIAMIAGLPKAPSRYNPITNAKRAQLRRNYVLIQMKRLGHIDEEAYNRALQTPVTAKLYKAKNQVEAPYLAEMVRAEMVTRYGNGSYTDGYTVFTTIDSILQNAANSSIRAALLDYTMRHGYRGPEKHFNISPTTTDEELNRILSDINTTGTLAAGIVKTVKDSSIEVFIRPGRLIEIDWDELQWARPFINENSRGPVPKSAAEMVQTGDVIRVQETIKEGKTRWRLVQIPAVEGALVSLEPNDGAIRALVGGFDYFSSKFNRVTQAYRQPGSGFKAFIYSAALESGFTPASLINDAPVVFDDPSLEGAWRPENYSRKFYGPTRLRHALVKSRNLVSIRLLRAMGINQAMNHVARFGFDTDKLPHNLSIALGSGSVTPLQMASAYAVLANGGYRIEPYFIDKIEDNNSGTLYQSEPYRVCEECKDLANNMHTEAQDSGSKIAPRVISPQNHYLMNSMMRDVINYGTGQKAKALGRNDLAGKTGTTNDQRDAWFNGFNRYLVAVTWVGFDESTPLGRGEVGGKAALPAWISFMETALQGIDEAPLRMPHGMVNVRIDPVTGKRASVDQNDAIFEAFRVENAPTEIAPSHSRVSTPKVPYPGGSLPTVSEEELF